MKTLGVVHIEHGPSSQRPGESDQADFCFTADPDDDSERTQQLYGALCPEQPDRQRLPELLRQQPSLRNRKAALHRQASGHELPTIVNGLLDSRIWMSGERIRSSGAMPRDKRIAARRSDWL